MSEDESPTAGQDRSEGVRSVARAIDILALFDERHPSLTQRELAAASTIPKTTVVRLLGTLQRHGLLVATGEATYTVGPVFLRWIRLAHSVWEVSPEARAIMRGLVEDFGETVNIFVRQDAHRISIAQEEGSSTVRSVVRVGAPMPMTAGATAKVLLGGVAATDLRKVLTDLDEEELAKLRRQAAAALETGYAVTHGERELGASAVAAPIRDPDDRVIAALSISGPTSRFTADRAGTYVTAVTRAATEISRVRLGTVEALL